MNYYFLSISMFGAVLYYKVINKHWDERWMVLNNNSLELYKSKDSDDVLEEIILENLELICAPHSSVKHITVPSVLGYHFRLQSHINKDNIYCFSAGASHARQRWINALSNIVSNTIMSLIDNNSSISQAHMIRSQTISDSDKNNKKNVDDDDDERIRSTTTIKNDDSKQIENAIHHILHTKSVDLEQEYIKEVQLVKLLEKELIYEQKRTLDLEKELADVRAQMLRMIERRQSVRPLTKSKLSKTVYNHNINNMTSPNKPRRFSFGSEDNNNDKKNENNKIKTKSSRHAHRRSSSFDETKLQHLNEQINNNNNNNNNNNKTSISMSTPSTLMNDNNIKKRNDSKTNLVQVKSKIPNNLNEDGILRIWTFTWNMGAKQLNSKQKSDLKRILPIGYDIYVLGIQEGTSNAVFDVAEKRLIETHVRVPIDTHVTGRGDGSFLSPKFTGIELFVSRYLRQYVHVHAMSSCSLGLTEGSKGASCFVLKLFDTNIVFLSCHLSSRTVEDRRHNYEQIVEMAGNNLGDPYFQLIQQFHHIIWMGDMNYRTSNAKIDEVLGWIKSGQLNTLRHIKYNELAREMETNGAFTGFKEPLPAMSFLPTYKKKENRSIPTNYDDPNWVNEVYRTQYKEPWYKTGQTKPRIPSYCDRVVYYSLPDLEGRLQPETVIDTRIGKHHNYCSLNESLSGSDHSAVYAGFLLHVKRVVPLRIVPSSYRQYYVRLTAVSIVQGKITSMPKSLRVLFPGPFEDVHVSPLSVQIQGIELGRGRQVGFSWTGVEAVDCLHFLLKIRGQENICGQCSVPLFRKDFEAGRTLSLTRSIIRNGRYENDINVNFTVHLSTKR